MKLKTIKTVTQSLTLFLTLTHLVNAQDEKAKRAEFNRYATWDDAWRDLKKIGYNKIPHETRIKSTKYAESKVSELPKSRLTKITTQEAWDKFIKQFPQISKDYKPDLSKEIIIVIADNQRRKKCAVGFSDIEVYNHQGKLKAFVFFGGGINKPVAEKKITDPIVGRLYIFSAPRKLANLTVEPRLAYQSWGRSCSKISPVITADYLKAGKTEKKAE